MVAEVPELRVDDARADDLRAASRGWPSIDLTAGQERTVELLATGALDPAASVFDLVPALAADAGDHLALRDREGVLLAALTVTSVTSGPHGARVEGPLEVVALPSHPDLVELRRTPTEVREALGGRPAVALALRDAPLAPELAALEALARERDAVVLLLGFVGDGDERFALARALSAAADDLNLEVEVALAPAPELTALDGVIARAYGVSTIVLDPVSGTVEGVELDGLEVVVLPEVVGGVDRAALRDELAAGRGIDPALVPAGVGDELPPRRAERGLVVLFTGLSGSGKSTVAGLVRARLLEAGGRSVTLLDGDLVRKHLSKGLGFSPEDRDTNVARIGWVAAEIAKHGGVCLAAPIAPHDRVRRTLRAMAHDAGGGFVLVHVATPLEVCEQRDRKGLYAKARAGFITDFTGIDAPYEVPTDAEVVLDATEMDADEAAGRVLAHLTDAGWVSLPGHRPVGPFEDP